MKSLVALTTAGVALLSATLLAASAQAPAAERFVMMAQAIRFDVKGLRQLAQSQELFQRLTTFLQSLGTNPALLMAFDSKYDIVKYMDDMMRAIRLV